MQLSQEDAKVLIASTLALDILLHNRKLLLELSEDSAYALSTAISVAATNFEPSSVDKTDEEFEEMMVKLHDANIALLKRFKAEVIGDKEFSTAGLSLTS